MPPSVNVLWLSRADVESLGVAMREGRRAAVLMGRLVFHERALKRHIGTWVEL